MPTRLPVFMFRVRPRAEKKTQAKEIHLKLSSADADLVEELFIIYRPHNCVLYSNLIWAYK
jgi:hypothetical protein